MQARLRLLAFLLLPPTLAASIASGPAAKVVQFAYLIPPSVASALAPLPGDTPFAAGLLLSAGWLGFALTLRRPEPLLAAGTAATAAFAFFPVGEVAWPGLHQVREAGASVLWPTLAVALAAALLLADRALRDARHLLVQGASAADVARHRRRALAAALLAAGLASAGSLAVAAALERLPAAWTLPARHPALTMLAVGLLAVGAALLAVPRRAPAAQAPPSGGEGAPRQPVAGR